MYCQYHVNSVILRFIELIQDTVKSKRVFKLHADNFENTDEDEILIASCDLTVDPSKPQNEYVVNNNRKITEDCSSPESEINIPIWKKYLCCKQCSEIFYDKLWMLAVRCTKIAPNKCYSNKCCVLLDCVSYFLQTISTIIIITKKKITIKTPSDSS